MAMETFVNFRKLWARIDVDLDPDVYELEIKDSIMFLIINIDYNISKYSSNKSVVITTTNPLGESNFYGYALIGAAIYTFLIVLILWKLLLTNSTKKFDYSNLKWN